ncbi:MAG: DUF1186 domain-containing protein [Desulfomonilaceae bacterium]
MDIQRIVTKLEAQDGAFPREALAYAIANRDVIIPELLGILAQTLENHEELLDQPKYMGHIYAMFLLAQFREKRAYPLLVQLFSLPGEIPFDLTGDVVTADLRRILASVSCGDDHLIRKLAENDNVNEYVRAAALEALLTLVAVGEKSRDGLINYFQSLFRRRLSREFSFVWNSLVSCSVDLYPGEVYEDIKQSYRDELVESFFVSMKEVEESIARGKEAALEDLKKDRQYTLVTDPIKDMEWWAFFKPPEPSRAERKAKKIGRNDPCPCGSGKKYKKCCGRP